MAKSSSSPKQVLGLLGDIIKLSAATVGAGVRITSEAAAKARPSVQERIEAMRNFSLSKAQEAEAEA